MRAIDFLIEYSMKRLDSMMGDKLLLKWKNDGEMYKDLINPTTEVTSSDILKWIESLDPTPNNKHVDWLVNRYAGKKGGIDNTIMLGLMSKLLVRYEQLVLAKKLKNKHKNLTQIKTYQEFKDMINLYDYVDTTSRSTKNKELFNSDEIEIIYDDNDYKVMIPKTKRAAQIIGKNTKWCTSAHMDNLFDYHNSMGALYTILHKKSNSRWQWSFNEQEYKDELNKEIDMNKFVNDHRKVVSTILNNYGGLDKAAQNDPRTWFGFITNPSEEEMLKAVTKSGAAIKHIKDPSEKVQLAAINQEITGNMSSSEFEDIEKVGGVINYIKNPTREAINLANDIQ